MCQVDFDTISSGTVSGSGGLELFRSTSIAVCGGAFASPESWLVVRKATSPLLNIAEYLVWIKRECGYSWIIKVAIAMDLTTTSRIMSRWPSMCAQLVNWFSLEDLRDREYLPRLPEIVIGVPGIGVCLADGIDQRHELLRIRAVKTCLGGSFGYS